VGEAVYAIDDFPDDDLFWRIEWIGGVGYNSSVPSDPLIDICLAQLRGGENNPLSARSRSSQIKRTVRIGVGLLPYIAIASVWRRRRPVFTNLGASRDRLCLDTSSCRIVPLADHRRNQRSADSGPGHTEQEQNGDPYAVMIPTAEIIRFYYATSTRLAQALFWESTIKRSTPSGAASSRKVWCGSTYDDGWKIKMPGR
jgi:hypothetical protein